MKKWGVIIAVALLVAVIWDAWSLYDGIQTKQEREMAKASETAKSQYHLKQVLDVSYYHGSHAYHVVKAINQKGKTIYIWIPESKGQAIIKQADEGWTKAKVKQYAKDQLNLKKLIAIRPGVELNTPVWEVVFIDQKNRYTFFYLRFDGENWVKKIHL
ncbi:MAG TPA: DUF5590 domain-containing protein [Bacillales bacterium]|nr:DUF5590 domain-containing protein [Bacillales bacterium]